MTAFVVNWIKNEVSSSAANEHALLMLPLISIVLGVLGLVLKWLF
ncbi:hypothetical protein [Paenibacillus sp. Leaf72]|nr:hypothetical protein [Paenibacillus sp. Leaf72]